LFSALAYRIDHDGASVVFSGDVQTAREPLVGLAAGCDLLVHDLALRERETEHGHLHAKPSEVGKVARDCDCRRLLVIHVMPELANELDDALELVRRATRGSWSWPRT